MTVSQHILRTLLAVLLPVALGLAWLLYSGWQAQQTGMREQLDALALQQQTLLDRQLGQGRRVAEGMAATSWAPLLDRHRCPVADMRQWLLGAYGFNNAVTLTRGGQVICSVLPVDAAAQQRVLQLPQLATLTAQRSTRVSDPMLAPISRRRVVVVSAPLSGAAPFSGGQVILSLELAALAQATRPAPPACLPGWAGRCWPRMAAASWAVAARRTGKTIACWWCANCNKHPGRYRSGCRMPL